MQTIYENYVKPKEKYSSADLDFSFITHPFTKDLVLSLDSNAIKKSLRNLVLTNHYERLFHPEIGSNLRSLLFELMTPVTATYIEEEIFNTITNFEPRVKLVNIEVTPMFENNAYEVSITYYEQHSTTTTTVDFFLERLR